MTNVREPDHHPQERAVEIVADALRVLTTRDGIAIPEDLVLERARNVVTGLGAEFDLVPPDPLVEALTSATARFRAANARALAVLRSTGRALTLAFLVAAAGAAGCGEQSLATACAPIPDGTYAGTHDDTFTFSGGTMVGWGCTPSRACPGVVACETDEGTTPTTFTNEGAGVLLATTPAGSTEVLALTPAVTR